MGSTPNFVVIIGESALFDGTNGRFFRIEVLFVLTIKIKIVFNLFNETFLPSFIGIGGVGLRSSSVYNTKVNLSLNSIQNLTFGFDGTFLVIGLFARPLFPAGRSGVPCFGFLLSCVSYIEVKEFKKVRKANKCHLFMSTSFRSH